MWKPEHRIAAGRGSLRYPSDLTDAEWALVAPLIPPARRGGRRRSVAVRDVLDAVFYVLATGCQWKYLPKDLPPKSTAHAYFMLWDWDGTLERIHEALYLAAREAAGREASPTAAVIDSQTAKAAQKGGRRLIRKASIPDKGQPHGGTERERHAAEIAAHGRIAWQRRHAYGKRSLVETAISRIKRINGGRLTSRTFGAQQNEAAIRITIANLNMTLARPVSVRVR